MLIAYLLKQHKVWKGCSLRIFAIGDTDSAKSAHMKAGLQKYIYMLRIDAEVFVSVDRDKTIDSELRQRDFSR